ncbi:hypothetical protein QCA50_017341 [Cerrena zonata]|uniref:NADH-ubiquinone oxidoreductase chain 1 n=1 Tax=Cerrena zonata TaxID=2478898 RepID=A0AAW0FMZ3_9APHY
MASFNNFWLYCLPLLVFESTAFCMVLRKAYQYVRDQRHIRGTAITSESGPSRLISVLYRDSLLYFAGISLVLVTTSVFFPTPIPAFLSSWRLYQWV